MAALQPASSEPIQTTHGLLEDKEAGIGKDWSGLQLTPAAWIERGLWFPPHNAEVSPAGLENSAKKTRLLKGQYQSEKGKRVPLGHQQIKKTSTDGGEKCNQTLKQSGDPKSSTKNQYACDCCDKKFQFSSHFAQHKNAHPGRKASRRNHRRVENQAAVRSPRLFTSVSAPLQMQNLFADMNERTCQNSVQEANKQKKKLHVCSQCEEVRQGQNDLDVNSQNPVAPALAPLQTENIMADSEETFRPKVAPQTDQRPKAKNPYFCEQSGQEFQWLSDLAHLQHVHSDRKRARQNLCELEACSSPIGPVLHAEERVASYFEMSSQTSKIIPHAKNLHIFGQGGKDFWWPSALTQRHHDVHSGEKTVRSIQDQVDEGEPRPLEPVPVLLNFETKFADETLDLKSVATVDRSHAKKLLPCDKCGKCFRYPSLLAKHQNVHSGKGKGRWHKRDSSKEIDPNPNPSSPQVEGTFAVSHKAFSPNSQLGQRTKRKKPYACNQCKKSFQWPSDLARHCRKKRHFKMCSLSSPSADQSLDKYWSKEMDPSPSPPQVEGTFEVSSKAFSPYSLLDQSANLKKPHTCSQCKKSFRWPSDLSRHCRRHFKMSSLSAPSTDQSAHAKNPLICQQCGRAFRYPSLLAQHQNVHSGKGKASWHKYRSKEMDPNPSPPASQADGTFAGYHKPISPDSKLMTGQSTTNFKKTYVCSQCEKSFRRPSNLARHESTHSRRKQHLKMSPPRGPRTERDTKRQTSFRCEECGKHFQCLSDFTEHVYTHSVERPYSCEICGLQFKRYVQLKKHEKWHEISEEEEEEEEEEKEEEEVEEEEEEEEEKENEDEDKQTYQDGHEENAPTEKNTPKQLQCHYSHNSEEHNKPFDSLGGCESDLCHDETSNRSEVLPQNNIWDTGFPTILSFPQTCDCGYCESDDGSLDV